jgi:hypothetical protein
MEPYNVTLLCAWAVVANMPIRTTDRKVFFITIFTRVKNSMDL